jgi:hypothetical protein
LAINDALHFNDLVNRGAYCRERFEWHVAKLRLLNDVFFVVDVGVALHHAAASTGSNMWKP